MIDKLIFLDEKQRQMRWWCFICIAIGPRCPEVGQDAVVLVAVHTPHKEMVLTLMSLQSEYKTRANLSMLTDRWVNTRKQRDSIGHQDR